MIGMMCQDVPRCAKMCLDFDFDLDFFFVIVLLFSTISENSLIDTMTMMPIHVCGCWLGSDTIGLGYDTIGFGYDTIGLRVGIEIDFDTMSSFTLIECLWSREK